LYTVNLWKTNYKQFHLSSYLTFNIELFYKVNNEWICN
jgi:hypothetical protein